MKKISSIARLLALTAIVGGGVVVASMQEASADPLSSSQSFTLSGDVENFCTITSTQTAGTMEYNTTNQELTTSSTSRPDFTVSCSAGATNIQHTITPTYTSGGPTTVTDSSNTECTISLVPNTGSTITASNIADCSSTNANFTGDITALNGSTSQTGEIDFSVNHETASADLGAGTYTYDVTLTWVP